MMVDGLTTLRKLIDKEVAKRGDRIVAWTLTDDEADAELSTSQDGVEFTAWGEREVYFPGIVDSYGPPVILSVPRHPGGKAVDAYSFDFRDTYG